MWGLVMMMTIRFNWRDWVYRVSAAVSVLIAVAAAWAAYNSGKKLGQDVSSAVDASRKIQLVNGEIIELRKELSAIRAVISKTAEVSSAENGNAGIRVIDSNSVGTRVTPPSGRELEHAINDLRKLELRLTHIEESILANPTKALEIPLMQRDIAEIKVTQQLNISALKDAIDRIYDLNKWLLGGMALSIFSMAIAGFRRPKESKEKPDAN